MEALQTELLTVFSPARLLGVVVAWLPRFAVALFLLGGFWLLWRLADRTLAAVAHRSGMDRTATAFVASVLKMGALILGVVTALGQLGVNTASILASLGVVGLSVGFAARDTLSNVISGLFIFWDRPFVLGDLIEVGDTYGKVDRVTMRSTRVITPDGRMVAIPNTVIVNTAVASYTNFPHLRIEVDAAIGVHEDLGRARSLLLALVADDPRFRQEPAPDVVVTALNDYNVAIRLRAWLADEQQHIPVRFELRERVFEALRGAGVEMPFETIELRGQPTR